MLKRLFMFFCFIFTTYAYGRVQEEDSGKGADFKISQKDLDTYEKNKRRSLLRRAKEILELNEQGEGGERSSTTSPFNPMAKNKILTQFSQIKEEVLADIQSGNERHTWTSAEYSPWKMSFATALTNPQD